jgi:hypothetical protein
MGGAMPMPQQPPGPGPMQAPQMPGTTASPMQNLNFASTPAAPRAPDTLSGSNRGFVTGTGGFGNGLNFARGGY